MARYLGRGQVGICQRSGKKCKRESLVEDGQVKGLIVDKDWYEPYHPQLLPPPMRAAGIPHFRPAPDDRLAPPAPTLALVSGGLQWNETSNNIAFTNYYVVSSLLAGVYTAIETIFVPDTYRVSFAGNLILTKFPFPVAITAPSGTVLVVQAHAQEGGYSAYSNSVVVP